MTRLWLCISGYHHAEGLRRACGSFRRLFREEGRFPIVYSNGRYERFPGLGREDGKSLRVARELASFIIDWPSPAPSEPLKRQSYMVGRAGDWILILDCDEEIFGNAQATLRELESSGRDHYVVPLRPCRGGHLKSQTHVVRLVRVRRGLNHWGAHECLFYGARRFLGRMDAATFNHLWIKHYLDVEPERKRAKDHYYGYGIREDESSFRRFLQRAR